MPVSAVVAGRGWLRLAAGTSAGGASSAPAAGTGAATDAAGSTASIAAITLPSSMSWERHDTTSLCSLETSSGPASAALATPSRAPGSHAPKRSAAAARGTRAGAHKSLERARTPHSGMPTIAWHAEHPAAWARTPLTVSALVAQLLFGGGQHLVSNKEDVHTLAAVGGLAQLAVKQGRHRLEALWASRGGARWLHRTHLAENTGMRCVVPNSGCSNTTLLQAPTRALTTLWSSTARFASSSTLLALGFLLHLCSSSLA